MRTINKEKTVFINVDSQIDFMEKEGSLYIQDAESIKPTLDKLTKFAENNNIRVVNTMDWHYEDSEELSDDPDFALTFPNHCMAETEGVKYVEETDPSDPFIIDWSINMGLEYLPNKRNIVIRKDKFNVFEGNPNTNRIFDILKQQGIETFVIYGVSGDICVSYAIQGVLDRGFNVILIKDGIKSLNEDSFNNSVDVWSKNDNFSIIDYNELSLN